MKRNLTFCIWGLFSSLLMLSSCVTTQEDILYVNNQIAALNQKVDKLDRRVGGELTSMREAQADTVAGMDRIKGDLQEVRSRLSDNRQLLQRAVERDTTGQDRMNRQVADLSRRVGDLESRIRQVFEYLNLERGGTGTPPGGTAVAPAEGVTAAAPPSPVKTTVPGDRALYDTTLGLYKKGNYEAALSGFKTLLNKYPRSELADNAQFWMGECHMAMKRFEQAILDYQQVIKTYPAGNKVPNAMLRQALAFYQINDRTSCRLLLKKIIKKYPRSSEARIARAKLKTIK